MMITCISEKLCTGPGANPPFLFFINSSWQMTPAMWILYSKYIPQENVKYVALFRNFSAVARHMTAV